MLKLLLPQLKKPTFLISYGIMLALFFPAFRAVDFDPFLCIVLILIAAIPAFLVNFLISGMMSFAVVATSAERVKELAVKYPELAELERQRSDLVKARLLFTGGCVVAFVVGLAAFGFIGAGIVFAVSPFVFLLLKFREKEAQLRKLFKQVVVLDVLNNAFTDVQLDISGHFSLEEIDGLRLFNGLDVLRGNDLFEAVRGTTRFSRCDLHLQTVMQYKEDEGGTTVIKTEYATIFNGMAFRFEASEPAPTRLLVATENFKNLRDVSDLKRLLGFADERSVETEMDAFNRRFNVYCDDQDQVSARILLTPQAIMGLNRVGQLTKHELAALYTGEKLYLFIWVPGVDSFEPDISSNKSLERQRAVIEKQAEFIASVVDTMYIKDDNGEDT